MGGVKILGSAPVPLELIGLRTGFEWVGDGPRGLGTKGLELGLDNSSKHSIINARKGLLSILKK